MCAVPARFHCCSRPSIGTSTVTTITHTHRHTVVMVIFIRRYDLSRPRVSLSSRFIRRSVVSTRVPVRHPPLQVFTRIRRKSAAALYRSTHTHTQPCVYLVMSSRVRISIKRFNFFSLIVRRLICTREWTLYFILLLLYNESVSFSRDLLEEEKNNNKNRAKYDAMCVCARFRIAVSLAHVQRDVRILWHRTLTRLSSGTERRDGKICVYPKTPVMQLLHVVLHCTISARDNYHIPHTGLCTRFIAIAECTRSVKSFSIIYLYVYTVFFFFPVTLFCVFTTLPPFPVTHNETRIKLLQNIHCISVLS